MKKRGSQKHVNRWLVWCWSRVELINTLHIHRLSEHFSSGTNEDFGHCHTEPSRMYERLTVGCSSLLYQRLKNLTECRVSRTPLWRKNCERIKNSKCSTSSCTRDYPSRKFPVPSWCGNSLPTNYSSLVNDFSGHVHEGDSASMHPIPMKLEGYRKPEGWSIQGWSSSESKYSTRSTVNI